MNLLEYVIYAPYFLVLASLLFSRRHYRHMLALLGSLWALRALNSSWPFRSPLEIFWLGMIIIHSLLLLRSAWLHILPLKEEHRILYHSFFNKFSRSNFKKLMEIGTIENKAHGAQLCKQGQRMEYVMCMLDGSAGVIIDGDKIASLQNGDFIGEISFLSGNRSSATVRTEVLSTLVLWRQDELKKLLQKNMSLLIEFNRTIERQISRRLTQHREIN